MPWITPNGRSRCSPNCGAFNGHDGRCNAPAERKVLMEDLVHDIVHVSIPHGPAEFSLLTAYQV